MIVLSVDDGPVGDPDANRRLYDLHKEQNQRDRHFMIRANIHDNLPGSGDVDCHCTASAPAMGGAKSANIQVISTLVGMINTATTYYRF